MPKIATESFKLAYSTISCYNKLIDNVLPQRCANILGHDDKDKSLIMSAIVSRFSMACDFCGSQESTRFSMRTQLTYCVECEDKHAERLATIQQAKGKPRKIKSTHSTKESTKRCTGPCGRTLPTTTEFFHCDKQGRYGVKGQCKECRKQRESTSRQAQFGELYNQMLINQNGVCAICKQSETTRRSQLGVSPLSIDHDHMTGRIRALLCQKCNTSLGMMGEDPERIRALADYAEWCRRERQNELSDNS